jgi:MFS transporter, ENTS family, enterobactin (siderophore) exporter
VETIRTIRWRDGQLRLWLLAAEIVVVASALCMLLENTAKQLPALSGAYAPWSGHLSALSSLVPWLLSATTEPNFYTSALSGLGLLVGGVFAHGLSRARRKAHGHILACGSGLWPAVVASALLGLLISNAVWGWTLSRSGMWQPTFVPFVSVSPTVVLVYGAGWRQVLTGAALGGVLTTPFSLLGTNYLCAPLGLPLVVGVTAGMAVGALAAFWLCRALPWLTPVPRSHDDADPPVNPPPTLGAAWVLRRALADFSEAQFFGNEWASAGLILGAIAAYLLNPKLPVYGSGLFPQVLLAQLVTVAAALALWRGRWARGPFYPTFVPIVSVAPAAVLAYGGSLQSIMTAGILGAVVAPPLAHVIAGRLPADFHPFIGNVASMAISTAVIVPPLGLLPGFTS